LGCDRAIAIANKIDSTKTEEAAFKDFSRLPKQSRDASYFLNFLYQSDVEFLWRISNQQKIYLGKLPPVTQASVLVR